jgi:hypothetical protein
MKNTGNTLKLVLAIVLLIALAAVITMQFMKPFKKTAATTAKAPVTAIQEKAGPPGKAAAPAKGTPAPAKPAEGTKPLEPAKAGTPPAAKVESKTPPPTAPAPGALKPEQPAAPPAGPAKPAEAGKAPPPAPGKPAPAEAGKPATPPSEEAKAEELPKISFMNEKVDKAFSNSRFFAVNDVLPSANPFMPIAIPVPPRPPAGMARQLAQGKTGAAIPPTGNVGEIPMLPMPNEILGEPIRVTLLGISQSGDTATALFSVGTDKSATNVMAHPGWLVGNDYVFVGAENGKAKVFDRKTNRVIQLATGETI